MYYPLLKHASNEMKALNELKTSSIKKVIPIIESKRIKPKDLSNWHSNFNTLGSYLNEKIGSFKIIYDFHTAIEDLNTSQILTTNTGKNLVEFCIEKFESYSLNIIPCFNHDSPDWIINSVLNSNYSEIAIRIRCGEFPEAFDQIVVNKLISDLKKLADNKKITVILDFFNKNFNADRIEHAINSILTLKPSNIVYLATNCPENADKAKAKKITLVNERKELKTFFNLRKKFSDLLFGDYTVRLKGEVIEGFNYYNSYIKIFYSSLKDYYIIKSELLGKNGESTFHEVCKELVNSTIYSGENFSYGDKLIKQCADKKMTIGDHQTPIAIGINHHIELTITQI